MNKPFHHTLCRWAVVVIAAASLPQVFHAQVQAEYFVDTDPGQGRATMVTVPIGNDGTLQFDLPLTDIPSGEHMVGIRAFSTTTDNQGTSHTAFGPTIMQSVLIKEINEYVAQQILYAEYFWGDDPGFGHGTSIPFTPGQEVNLSNIEIPTNGLTPGEHLLSLRTYGTKGWGPTVSGRVLIREDVEYQTQQILYAEYFWGDDPGFGQGISIPITEGQELNLANIQIPTDGLTPGEHLLSVRAYASKGWGPTITQSVLVKGEYQAQQILYAEYFWGNDPGFGKGSPILITPGQEVNIEDLQVPTGDAHGSSILSIRAYGSKGWGPTIVTDVLVDAEGNYTLNATAATSISDRNYQTLSDLFTDFADRGVGDDVTLTVVGTATDYTLDATTDEVIEQLATIATNLDAANTSRDERVITFTAAEGSGNSLSITTTDDALPTVVGLFAHIATENVALTINGTAYDFTATSVHHEELCSGTATQPVALSSIGGGITASWTAQPHSGTTISGYMAQSTGDLPTMTLTNSGTQCDSLTVAVTLKDANNRVLTTYDYTYVVHATVASQTFATLTPATGSSLNPGTTQLQWSAIGDAVGYRLTISQQTMGDTSATPVEQTIETDATTYEVTVESGMEYTWTVTAIGACDELTSPAMTFCGRLLPDLVVTAITLPEAAQAGNTLTVTATITNQGAGATTEGTWTDRLYYTVNSTNFDDAIQLAEVQHSGNIAGGENYEATFETTTPMEDSGQLRVFVVTNVNGNALESNTDNNRTMSTTTAELRPFYMDTEDLAALRKLYTDFGGEQWNGEAWDITATIIRSGNWSGVTFDSDGHVTAINLQGRGLTGTLSATTAPTLPLLTALNLSRNALTGDAATFVDTNKQPLLTSLDLSYNQLEELTAVIPAAITTLDLTNQHRTYGNNKVFPGIDDTEPIPLDVSSDMTVALPAIATYNHARQAFTAHSQLTVYDRNYQSIGTLTWKSALSAYTFAPNSWKVTAAQQAEVVVVPTTSSGNNYTNARNSAFRAQLTFTAGDANLSGWTDVNDVQRTLNYVLNSNNSSTFGLWAANTYDDDSYDATDETINIQDIVCTVNIVLDNEEATGTNQWGPRRIDADQPLPAAYFYTEGRQVKVETTDEIAALTMQLNGVSASQVRLLLRGSDWQMQTRNTGGGVNLVIFSPTGQVLPTGATALLRLSSDGEPIRVQATNAMAEEVAAAIGTSPDGIAAIKTRDRLRVTAADHHIVVTTPHAMEATTISIYSATGLLLGQHRYDTLPAGDTRIPLNTAADVVIVRVSNAETGISNFKITTKP